MDSIAAHAWTRGTGRQGQEEGHRFINSILYWRCVSDCVPGSLVTIPSDVKINFRIAKLPSPEGLVQIVRFAREVRRVEPVMSSQCQT